ncbi:FAD-dependent oxidoreductase [Streptomyces sp. A7024]|uniref:FAD-dependent oxidoreductase n=1 Tax=Streptomyces coryli TaxID=1128680 RepID=A0A6G4TRC6_9ACTN|nr:FAD-dependent oxidoreductase [Streptomyces coryli]NGN62342.1 FAD-dependent oxidoreductase [Streptomyces coryli]
MTAARLTEAEAAALPLLWEGDVAVAGGGSAGCAAAVAAARLGARTLLIEGYGFLGGTGTAVLDTFYGFYAPGPDAPRVVGGIGWEVCEALTARGEAFERPNTYGAGTGVTYEPEALKAVWDELTSAAGADVLLHARVTGVVLDGDRVTGLAVDCAGGPRLVRAAAVIDATGDAEVAWRAGCALERPRRERPLQPMTTTFRIAGVDLTATPSRKLHALMAEAAASGAYDLPRREGSVHRTVHPGTGHTNLTRVTGLDPTDPWDLSRAESEGRRQAAEYLRFLRERVPGYEDAVLTGTSVRIGVRESRRLAGRTVLRREDVLAARDFPDAIARCGAPVEDHDGGTGTVWAYVGGARTGLTYGVPYGCLVPRTLRGLLVAGRCLSATHDAHASVRSMAQCMATGQAAGAACALSVRRGADPGGVDVAELRGQLLADGVIL